MAAGCRPPGPFWAVCRLWRWRRRLLLGRNRSKAREMVRLWNHRAISSARGKSLPCIVSRFQALDGLRPWGAGQAAGNRAFLPQCLGQPRQGSSL